MVQILNDTTQHAEKWSIAVDSMHESVPFSKGFRMIPKDPIFSDYSS